MIVQAFRPAENRWAIGGWDLPSLQLMGATGGSPSIYRHFATCELCGERTQQARKISGPKSRFTRNILTDAAELGIWRPRCKHEFNRPRRIRSRIGQGLLVCSEWHKDGT